MRMMNRRMRRIFGSERERERERGTNRRLKRSAQ
jgi:hypothetical protein